MNKVVARYVDGRMHKGFTNDFTPAKDEFHIALDGAAASAPPIKVRRGELKALFFVKDFAGNPEHDEKKDLDAARAGSGRKIRVVFKDGEELVGTTLGYQSGRPGFFLELVDKGSNIERCYVVTAATREVSFIVESATPRP
ncbi:MAG TPA: hypothetical protein VFX92_03080 [Candidatus Krumholzibacteria bacterium]|nr:hypothetical protein [Candidatus Krumholzibacteria bacterium]